MSNIRWFTRGDSDGFVGLFIDNLLQLLLISVLCPAVCGLPAEMIVGRILPAAALSILAGNLFYSWQAWQLARRTGRTDVTALPYGVNTVSLIAHVFLIMGPIWRATHDIGLVMQAGIFSCMMSGIIELGAAFVIDPVRRFLPRAALLSTLAGVAITFIAMGFAFQIFAAPAVAVVPMLLIVMAYAGRIRLPWGIPAGLAAILIGAGTAWVSRWLGHGAMPAEPVAVPIGWHLPVVDPAALSGFLAGGHGWRYLSVVLPMAIFNVMGSLQSLDSAEAAGDRYETRPSLAANGIGSLVAGIFGSPFPTTIYIGHPGWKAMGARIGYSAVNGIVICALCFCGAVSLVLRVVPLEATLGILIWIGIVMTAQAYQETPKEHALAVSLGLVPALGAWAFLLIETTARAAGMSMESLAPKFGADLFIGGVIALNQGFLLSSMLLAGMVAFVVDRRHASAAVCAAAASLLSAAGVMHAWQFKDGAVAAKFGWMAAPAFAGAYALIALFLWGAAFVAKRRAGRGT